MNDGYAVRCSRCGTLVRLKSKTKTIKYCQSCRKALQDDFRKQVSNVRQARTQNLPVGAVELKEYQRVKENS